MKSIVSRKYFSKLSPDKIRNLKQKIPIIVILVGIFPIGVTILLTRGSLGIFIRNKQNDSNNIVAPYYDRSIFQKPLEFDQIAATSSITLRNEARHNLPIIMYHYVEYVADAGDLIRKKLDISPDNFERQLKAFKNAGFEGYFVRDIDNFLKDKNSFSSNKIFLTFDDGYEDFYSSAFPLLKKYNLKATVYIIDNYIGKKGYLGGKEIKELIDSRLVEIGSHTLNHIYLKQAPSTLARREIFESKKNLEDKFGIKVETFAYPYGAFTRETVDLVKEAGYTAAVSVILGKYQSTENLYYLSRIRGGFFSGTDPQKVLEKISR